MEADPARVLSAWNELRGGQVAPLGRGLINDTYSVQTDSGRFVLQRVNPIFGGEVHADIEAVTARLAERGLVTPRLVRTTAGELFTREGAEVWRVMTWIDGRTFDRVQDAAQARAAGELLAGFHSALADLDHVFQSVRVGVHDTPAHLARLRTAIAELGDHRLYDQVAPLAEELLAAAETLPVTDALPLRVVHGDPKLNNMLFDPSDVHRGICMVDLDTCARMELHLEIGDAWRSWCNPSGEDATVGTFDLEVYRASWEGYRAGCTIELTDDERAALLYGVEWITLELAARFLTDALREVYFGWDSTRHASRGEHNLLRARGQWALHGATMAVRAERAAVLD